MKRDRARLCLNSKLTKKSCTQNSHSRQYRKAPVWTIIKQHIESDRIGKFPSLQTAIEFSRNFQQFSWFDSIVQQWWKMFSSNTYLLLTLIKFAVLAQNPTSFQYFLNSSIQRSETWFQTVKINVPTDYLVCCLPINLYIATHCIYKINVFIFLPY